MAILGVGEGLVDDADGTLTPTAMVQMDSPRWRRARIAAPVLRQGQGQVEDQGALGVLAGRDALQHLDRDVALEQVVQDDAPFQEVAAEPVDEREKQELTSVAVQCPNAPLPAPPAH
ncbi:MULTISPECIES: hypothetical protein [unclassified Nonomuraea]|uniref:hypothetical protein n=1 Tax=unclassified Nonomuraea TaxID=2593643 RepID=UPI00342BAC96